MNDCSDRKHAAMHNSRAAPVITLTLALLLTIFQIFRSVGGSYDEFVLRNFDVGRWALLYD